MLVVAGDRNNHAAHRANLRIRSLRVHNVVCPDVKHDLKMAASIAALVGGWNVAPLAFPCFNSSNQRESLAVSWRGLSLECGPDRRAGSRRGASAGHYGS